MLSDHKNLVDGINRVLKFNDNRGVCRGLAVAGVDAVKSKDIQELITRLNLVRKYSGEMLEKKIEQQKKQKMEQKVNREESKEEEGAILLTIPDFFRNIVEYAEPESYSAQM